MAFYLPQSERMAMEFQVEKALKKSLTFLEGKYEI
jgi:hypothetical protein